MDALTALHTRNSVNLLTEPGPTDSQLENIYQAGLRACDHKSLTPWKFLQISGDARLAFGELMADTKAASEGEKLDPKLRAKLISKPLRAPMIIAVVAKVRKHEKVPDSEQVWSAAGSAQMMMTSAHAQGLGAIWRSGSMMFHSHMREGLGLDPRDQIVGFLYLGRAQKSKQLPERNSSDFVKIWNG